MSSFVAALKLIVGNARVLTDSNATRPYRTGFRYGTGVVLAVVSPRSLVELWRVLQACTTANKIVIVQAANTGLTGGSTPAGDDYDREVVIVNTMSLAKLYVIDQGRQVICLPGTTLYQLEQALEPFGREPHSVIGSSCIGASVLGGISNNSGGALLQRGPAFTQMALFARVTANGELQLVNHLGVSLGQDAEQMLARLDRGEFNAEDIEHDSNRWGSDRDYARRLREIDSDVPARFNANPERLFEASGCAGKVVVFAARLDTFAKEPSTRVFYIGTQDPAELTDIRRHMLSRFQNLPVAGEYMHRDMFDVADTYGKDAFLIIHHLGTRRLPALMNLKRRFDDLVSRLGLAGCGASDVLLQRLSGLFPNHLPVRMRAWRDRFEHHLILKMAGDGIQEAADYLSARFPSSTGDVFECTEEEAEKAFLHRFVAAGAAIRYRAMHRQEVEDIVALDVALRRNDPHWFEAPPSDIRDRIHLALYYGHFFCHVFHQDYLVRKGANAPALEHRLLRWFDERGAECPAEHNVGHLYPAKPALAEFYRALDPCNQFNPGIGQTSKRARWQT
ncbi:D-lactate dehydrogenase [Steroidobacter sp.]|uniref:D-lactate dehydrogenase n=1 Tax=Steroidobacter sp. TaxID=1978227 RepID=UPI001A4F5FCD|nr:D-lactate dehydrogenase [Steroidobacter sp.]MBL8268611.1 D-lactate dehydrogenase [Steroidobacter sp.]